MASIFGHAAAGAVLGKGMLPPKSRLSLCIGIILTMLPDADVIGFMNGVSYDSPWGHRGFTHSIFFALVIAAICNHFIRTKSWRVFLFFFLCMSSHGLLDGMTSGGRGVAYFWPIDDSRYFLPWRPIKVSPLSLSGFLSQQGWQVIRSEALYIGLPSAIIWLLLHLSKKKKHGDQASTDPR